jgi:hypothetical protein
MNSAVFPVSTALWHCVNTSQERFTGFQEDGKTWMTMRDILNAIRGVWQLRVDRLNISLNYALVPVDWKIRGVRVYSCLLTILEREPSINQRLVKCASEARYNEPFRTYLTIRVGGNLEAGLRRSLSKCFRYVY